MELIVISQNNCSGCRLLEQYLKNEHSDLEYTYINVSEQPEYIEKYNVMATPKTILVEDGEVFTSLSGFTMAMADEIDLLVEQV